MSVVYWNNVCGNSSEDDALWSDNISWNTTNPDLTLCFQKTVIVWIPCVYLWVSCLCYVPFLYSKTTVNAGIRHSKFNVFKTILSVLLSLVSLVELVIICYHHVNGHSHQVADFVKPSLSFLTFLLSGFVCFYEFSKGVYSGGVLFLFWLLNVLLNIVPFRSNILHVEYNDEGSPNIDELELFILFYISYGLLLGQFFCNLFSDKEAIPWLNQMKRNAGSDETRPLLFKKSEKDDDHKPCPESMAPFWQRILYLWMTSFIVKGYRTTLTFDDLWKLLPENKCHYIIDKMTYFWKNEVKSTNFKMVQKNTLEKSQYESLDANGMDYFHKDKSSLLQKDDPMETETELKQKLPSLWNVMARGYGAYYLLGGFYYFLYIILNFISPIILDYLITFISEDSYDWRGYMYILVLFVISMVRSVLNQCYYQVSFMTGLRLRTAVIGMVYRKALKLNSKAKSDYTVGQIVNLMSVDAQKLQDVPPFLHNTWAALLTIIISLYFLWQQLGYAVITGFVLMLATVPVNVIVVQKTRQFQVKQMLLKDQRLKLINEVLSGIKVLKLYGWETSFRNRILEIRKKELKTLWYAQICNVIHTIVFRTGPFFVGLACFVTYTLISPENVLDANKAFVSLTLLNIMTLPLIQIPTAFTYAAQAYVSVGRIAAFLRKEELDPDNVKRDISMDKAITVKNGTFSWQDDLSPSLQELHFSVQRGKLLAVVGQVGSGKSSLISALLGDMEVLNGEVKTKGSIAYVPQQAWIQNTSVQDNILFGENMHTSKYSKILDACALTTDLQILPGGDQTEIGEKGINLSGGQKQRVSLARAVYQDSDIYLFDDPLSAVDAHVGKHIFEHVLGPTGMLQQKTRILVTNAVTFLPQVDVVICLKDGKISEMGSYDELLSHTGAFSEFIETYLNDTEEDVQNNDDKKEREDLRQRLISISQSEKDSEADHSRAKSTLSASSLSRKRKSGSKLASEMMDMEKEKKKLADKNLTGIEEAMKGRIGFQVLKSWVLANGVFCMLTMVGSFVIMVASMVLANLWLSEWSNDQPNADGTQVISQRNLRIGVYSALGAALLISNGAVAMALAVGAVNASRKLHNELVKAVVRAPMSFYDTTPLGRIINRLSKDVDVLDANLPLSTRIFSGTSSLVLTTLIITSYTTPIFIVVIIPLFIFYLFIQRGYVTTSRQLMRIDSVKRSPIFAHFSETITGANSIRAYDVVDKFIDKSDKLIDHNQMAYYTNIVSQRWLGIILDFVGNLIVLFAGIFAVLQKDTITPGLAGVSVSYALQLTMILQVWVRATSDLENYVVAVERIEEYTKCPQEAPNIVEGNTPSSAWPDEGCVEFASYATRYRDGLDLVLRSITCKIQPEEKIGIVGRTGAGKSSMTLALFRIIEAATGKISIDSKNISKLGLQDLRTRITIIPQDPVIFSGTIRMNIDPTSDYTDPEVWQSLELAHLKRFIQAQPNGLNFVCGEGGENMSVGQRQLLCLARALLRRSKVLVLDEATAAVDLETDDLIQSTIRTEFKHSTVITIAHRLNTIMDYDRVMVLDQGNIIEIDSPGNLMSNKDSVFYGMAYNAGLVVKESNGNNETPVT